MTSPSLFTSFVYGTMDFLRYVKGFEADEKPVDGFTWSFMTRQPRINSSSSSGPLGQCMKGPPPHHKPDEETVVFLHGFSSAKESWTRVAGALDRKYKIIVPDLPGQGRTTPADALASYSMDQQASRLHAFLQETANGDKPIHIVGCSMGGMLAGVYAAMYPEHVRSLTMICPAGITMPQKSDTLKVLEETGKNLLLATTADDLIAMNAYISHSPRGFPRWLASAIGKDRERQLPVLQKIVDDTFANQTILEDHLSKIQAHTLVMWGRNDRVLDISSLEILQNKLQEPLKRVLVFEDCGHILQHEKHAECAKAINEFIAEHAAVASAPLSSAE